MDTYWWGFSKTHGWVVLDRDLKCNQAGQTGDLIFYCIRDSNAIHVPRAQWNPPHIVFAPNYLQGRSDAERDEFESLKASIEQLVNGIKEEALKELLEQKQLQAIENHKNFLSGKGLPYRGVAQRSGSRTHRLTHCYACKDSLDNEIQSECAACKWIICECGACGCGYERRSY